MSGLVAIARDHAAYVQGLTRQRTLLERRIYVVVPWSSSAEESAPRASFLRRLLGTWHRSHATADDKLRAESIHRLLGDRCDVINRQLGRSGLRATRADDLGLAQLYRLGWAPEVARTQRLRRELADYTALVVSADPRLKRPGVSLGARGDPGTEERSSLDPWRSQ